MGSTSTVPAPAQGALAGGSSWKIDPAHSHVEFAVRHLMISSVKGAFGDVQGTVWVDESDARTVLVDTTIQAPASTRVRRNAMRTSALLISLTRHAFPPLPSAAGWWRGITTIATFAWWAISPSATSLVRWC